MRNTRRLGAQATSRSGAVGGVGGQAGHGQPGDDPCARAVSHGQAKGHND